MADLGPITRIMEAINNTIALTAIRHGHGARLSEDASPPTEQGHPWGIYRDRVTGELSAFTQWNRVNAPEQPYLFGATYLGLVISSWQGPTFYPAALSWQGELFGTPQAAPPEPEPIEEGDYVTWGDEELGYYVDRVKDDGSLILREGFFLDGGGRSIHWHSWVLPPHEGEGLRLLTDEEVAQ